MVYSDPKLNYLAQFYFSWGSEKEITGGHPEWDSHFFHFTFFKKNATIIYNATRVDLCSEVW